METLAAEAAASAGTGAPAVSIDPYGGSLGADKPQAVDPRLAAKRRKLADPRRPAASAATAAAAVAPAPVAETTQQIPSASSSPAATSQNASVNAAAMPPTVSTAGPPDLSARILSELGKRKPVGGASSDGAAAPKAAAEPALAEKLLASLKQLLPAVTTAAGEKQQTSANAVANLVKVVEEHAKPPEKPVIVKPFTGNMNDTIICEGGSVFSASAPTYGYAGATVRAAPKPSKKAPRQLDESESDEEGPVRLPPGFGAVPEELVKLRALQLEDQRMRAYKSTLPCKFGVKCKKRDCPNRHPEGREIDGVLNLCAFGKRCKRKDCFYDHPEGRDLDNDDSKALCKWGAKCKRADCLYMHPPDRVAIAGLEAKICYFCQGSGHIAQECPINPTSYAYSAVAASRQLALANVPT
eukprot:TRINITY_DN44843_c0_g1_i1.p1 TRINITY_DN44843_c0_g1~~TRINITY_DN44843_c0_g1_i1.p1  ORF type:complete len:412 (+),score=95.71 TRINITY_DN44843_c0_g1_i1:102-1337(+)